MGNLWIIYGFISIMWVDRNVIGTTIIFDGEHTTHKNGDEWEMVYYCYTNIKSYRISLHVHFKCAVAALVRDILIVNLFCSGAA